MDSRRSAAFRLLGIPAGSDREAIVQAYHRLARLTHPDVSADPEAGQRFAALTAAYRLASELPEPDVATLPSQHPERQWRASAQSDTAADPAPSGWAGFLADVAASPWQRPPIVAGPVSIRPSTRAAGGDDRDG